MPVQRKETATITGETEDQKLQRFKDDISDDADIIQDQREQANEDSQFTHATGGMWQGDFGARFNTNRARLELDLISEQKNRFLGEVADNNIGVEFKPDDDATTDDDAELLNGQYRADYQDGNGEIATMMAMDDLADAGFGAFKLGSDFEDNEDPENEAQRSNWRDIVNPWNTVYFDASAKRPNKSDALHCTVLTEYTSTAYKKIYPDKNQVSAFTPTDNQFYSSNDWSGQKLIYVAERYEVVRKKTSLFRYHNAATGQFERFWADEHKEEEGRLKKDSNMKFIGERKIIRQTIMKSVFNGEEFFEKAHVIPGKWIPVIPIYGYRSYSNGQEYYYGLIRKFKDAQRLYNMLVSDLMEHAASTEGGIPIFEKGQLDSPNGEMVDSWQNRTKKAFLYVNPVIDKATGQRVQDAAPISYTPSTPVNPATDKLMEIVPNYIQAMTGGVQTDKIDPDASGKAIALIIKRQNMSTAVLMRNIRHSIQWSGVVYQSIASEIRGNQSMVRTLSKDGTRARKKIRQVEFDEEKLEFIETNIMANKKFMAYADVGPAYDSQREESIENLKNLIELLKGIPGGEQYLPAAVEELITLSPGVGMSGLKKMVRKSMLLAGNIDPETPEEEKMVADAQAQAQEPTPEQKLVESAALQAESEAKERDSKVLDNVASAEKKGAETQKILAEIGLTQAKTESDIKVNEANSLAEIRKQIFETAGKLPLN